MPSTLRAPTAGAAVVRSRRSITPVEHLEPRRLLAAALLEDINKGEIGSDASEFVEFKGAVYFAATGPLGRELYRSDGTRDSATLVADLVPGYVGSEPSGLTVVGDTLFFSAATADAGNELWKTDGTGAGTVRVADLVPGPVGSGPQLLRDVGGRLYFVADDGKGGEAVWASDGTEAGTVLVADPGEGPYDISEITFSGGRLYFLTLGNPRDGGPQLWAVVPGAAPQLLHTWEYTIWTRPHDLTPVRNGIVLSARNAEERPELWVSDGTAAGTRMMDTGGLFVIREFLRVGDLAYFRSSEGVRRGLWYTDGSGVGGSLPDGVSVTYDSRLAARADGTVFFEADDGAGPGLWRTGGGRPPTLVKRVPAADMGVSGDTLYFRSGGELWKSDGTEAGTVRVRPFAEDYYSGPKDFFPWRGGVAFQADDLPLADTGYQPRGEPWFSDGTPAGTFRLGDVQPATLSSGAILPPVRLGGRLLFPARQASGAVALWGTDGTTEGTRPVPGLSAGVVYALAAINDGTALVLAQTDGEGYGVWRTDGNTVTFVAPVVLPTACDCNRLDSYAVMGGALYFPGSPRDDYAGIELMKSDGTAAGTGIVKDLHPTPPDVYASADPMNLTAAGGYVYFTANGGEYPTPGGWNELWRTDGTEAGTVKLREFRGAGGATNARDFFDAGGTLYFRADGGGADGGPTFEQLWKTDGTPQGTVMLREFERVAVDEWLGYDQGMALLGGSVYFAAPGGAGLEDVELWKTDGTPAGTVKVKDVNPGAGGSLPQTLRAFAGRVYFSADDGSSGRELWASDGTDAGTVRVADLNGRAASSDPVVWGEVDGRLYFTADDGPHGPELWSIDAGGAGAELVEDVRPGPARQWADRPTYPTAVDSPGGPRVVFWADDGTHGTEPWVTVPQQAGDAYVVGRYVFYNNSVFDGRSPAADARDDAAVAVDKLPLEPGDLPTFENVTSYSRGINGVMIDVLDLPAGGSPTAEDFAVRASTAEGVWTQGPAPASVSLRRGAGVGRSDRVTLTWRDFGAAGGDRAVANGWLEVTVRPTARTGLALPEVFWFGNLVGETGNDDDIVRVNAIDMVRTRAAQGAVAAITSPLDANRDGRVNAVDLGVVRANQLHVLPQFAPLAGAALRRRTLEVGPALFF